MLRFPDDLPDSLRVLHAERRDWRPPHEVAGCWCAHDGTVALLSDGGVNGRWSYLAADPVESAFTFPGDQLPEALARLTTPPRQRSTLLPPFTGGWIGLASFELGMALENLRPKPFRIEGGAVWPDLILMAFDAVAAFDHHESALWLIGRGPDEIGARAACQRLQARLSAAVSEGVPEVSGALIDTPLRSETPDLVHEDKVAALIRQIHAGDLFQANLARGWTGRLKAGQGPEVVLTALQKAGASPFGALLRTGGRAVVSNSPERFISLDAEGNLQTRPIKGTRPRGPSPEADRALATDLTQSAKDRAENLMIVDLMRHDLAKVADPGTVRVPALNALESFTSVHHLVSTVTAKLKDGLTAADVLRATLPPGSVSGAPKVQAMKVIRDMEAPRGPYCGALFWVDVDGGMDSSVLIRTLALESDATGQWHFRVAAGGGIVADSDPGAERLETETKLALIRRTLEG